MILSLIFATLSFASGHPNDFVGEYQLRETRFGLCYDSTSIETVSSTGPADLDFGSGFRFFGIGAGTVDLDDELVRTTWTAAMTGPGSLVQNSTLTTKPSGVVSRTHSTAVLSGTTLHLGSTTSHQDADGETSFRTECVYKKVK